MNLPATLDAMLLTDLRVEQAQVMINFRDCCHRGFLAALAKSLLDSHGRWYAGDIIDIGPRHHLEELPRVSRETIDIPALSFGVDDVESKRGFSRTAQPGKDHEAVARNIDTDIFEIVFLGADDGDGVHIHG